MTFSIVGRCAQTQMFGAIVASSSIAVAARCIRARAGVGAACSQNITDPALGVALLDGLAAGASAQRAIADLVAATRTISHRQLAAVGISGGAAVFSGESTLGVYASYVGPECAAAGNLLNSRTVPEAMTAAFAAQRDSHIGDRLIAALRAGRDAGGEVGPLHSAGILIVDRASWPVTDLRVDWSNSDPVEVLVSLWMLWKSQADAYLARALDPANAPAFAIPDEPDDRTT